jgi:L-2-hydroxyglutarate oxidase LhgO
MMSGDPHPHAHQPQKQQSTHVWDVVVVGAGVMGSACAWRLAVHYGVHNCLLLEQFAERHHTKGSSHGGSRIIRRAYPEDHYTHAMTRAYELWHQVEKERVAAVVVAGSGVDAEDTLQPSVVIHDDDSEQSSHHNNRPIFHQTGGLDLAPLGDPQLEAIVAACQRHGVSYERLSADQVNQRFPPFCLPDTYEAIYNAEADLLEATRCVQTFQDLAERVGGCTIQTNAIVKDIVFQPQQLQRDKNDRKKNDKDGSNVVDLLNVILKDGTIHKAKTVVITMGAWASTVLLTFSCFPPLVKSIPLKPQKAWAMYWKVVDDSDNNNNNIKHKTASCPTVPIGNLSYFFGLS